MPSGLILDLNADVGVLNGGSPVGNAGQVDQWVDQSGVSGDALQADMLLQPQYFIGAGPNGHNIISFAMNQLVVAALTAGTFTVFAVYSAAGLDGILYEQGANAFFFSGFYMYPQGAAQVTASRGAGTLTAFDTNTPLNDNTFRITTHRFDGTDAGHALAVNGTTKPRTITYFSQNPGTSSVTAAFNIGARDGPQAFLSGFVTRLIVYNRVLTAVERNAIEQSLGTMYGISVAGLGNPLIMDDRIM